MCTRTRSRRARYRTVTVALALACAASVTAATPPAEWNFAVRLDGKPIGSHRFVLASAGDDALALTSDARFELTVLGVPLYRYRHQVIERWNGGCLAAIQGRTDDNGRLTELLGSAQPGRFELSVREGDEPSAPVASTTDCLMSFAYWNPELAGQEYLLDPGSGRIEAVAIASASVVPDDLAPRAVRGVRISGLPQPIDVWYVDDRWVGLDTVVRGGRRLSYRLE